MKALEVVIDSRVRNIVKLAKMQFGFLAGQEMTASIVIVRQLQVKFKGKSANCKWLLWILKRLMIEFQRRVVWWALRTLGVEE